MEQTNPSARKPSAVLVVDDDPHIAAALALVLGRAGYAVQIFAGGSDLLAALDRGDPADVLVCDVEMPEMSGYAIHAELRDRYPALLDFTIFITASDAQPGPLAPCRLLKKPFDVKALRDLVAELIAKRNELSG